MPFLIWWPGFVPSATLCQEWIGHLNVLPTLSAWCGLKAPKLPLDGFDASATLLHRETAPAKPVIYFSVAGGKNDVNCVRAGAWKMCIAQNEGEIYMNDRTQGRTNLMFLKPELYHLKRDSYESYDVSKKIPEMVQRFQSELAREMSTFPAETQAAYAALQTHVASGTTPAPRILAGPLPSWAWEPADQR